MIKQLLPEVVFPPGFPPAEEPQANRREDDRPVGDRERTAYLNLIAGLEALLLGETPSGKSQPPYPTQAAIIEALIVEYPNKYGLKQRSIEMKLAEARRSIKSD